jgi:hypothetical protein
MPLVTGRLSLFRIARCVLRGAIQTNPKSEIPNRKPLFSVFCPLTSETFFIEGTKTKLPLHVVPKTIFISKYCKVGRHYPKSGFFVILIG